VKPVKYEAELLDVVELLVDLPEHKLRVGDRGAVVACYPDHTYEIEFTNEDGETLATCPLPPSQFIVVWLSSTQSWVPIVDQVTALINRLPEGMEQEVLDFVRFLHARRQTQSVASPAL
jgi:hypothetical protein